MYLTIIATVSTLAHTKATGLKCMFQKLKGVDWKESYNQAALFSCLVLEIEVKRPRWDISPLPQEHLAMLGDKFIAAIVCAWGDYTYWEHPGMVSSCIIHSTALPTPSKESFSLVSAVLRLRNSSRRD